MGEKKERKISSLTEEDQKKVRDSLLFGGKQIQIYEAPEGFKENKQATKRLGLCGTCKNLEFVEGEYGSVYAYCDAAQQRLSGNERVKKCSVFDSIHNMSLGTAMSLAWIIDDDKKERIGF